MALVNASLINLSFFMTDSRNIEDARCRAGVDAEARFNRRRLVYARCLLDGDVADGPMFYKDPKWLMAVPRSAPQCGLVATALSMCAASQVKTFSGLRIEVPTA
ncbi:MAG TPA: hypothetical protein VJ727_05790 [Rhodanobacteraceae bacterium]|nr:hypothetical protein [Rhodanobacteraceae bacterium]